LITRDPTLHAREPFVLMLPTYGAGKGPGVVPKQVIKFLNVKNNRELIQGVIAAGNTNFYDAYCLAGDIISAKTNVPLMYRFELKTHYAKPTGGLRIGSAPPPAAHGTGLQPASKTILETPPQYQKDTVPDKGSRPHLAARLRWPQAGRSQVFKPERRENGGI